MAELLDQTWALDAPLDLPRTTGIGGHDPCARVVDGSIVQALNTPAGPATLQVRSSPATGQVHARAWGRGAQWALEATPSFIGLADRPPRLGGALARYEARLPGIRLGRALDPFDLLISTIIRQRVAWRDAKRTRHRIIAAHGGVAPGPFDLRVPLAPPQWRGLAAHDLAAFGLERKRASTILAVAVRAERIVGWLGLGLDEFGRRLELLPGIGAWSRASVQAGLGDPDAVPLGDWDLPSMVAHTLAGEARATDARMLELLEPWRGHRMRVIRLLWAAGLSAPRFGPRRRGNEPGQRGF